MNNEIGERQFHQLLFDETICQMNYCSLCTNIFFVHWLGQIRLVFFSINHDETIEKKRQRYSLFNHQLSFVFVYVMSSFQTHQKRILNESIIRILERLISSLHTEVCDTYVLKSVQTFSASIHLLRQLVNLLDHWTMMMNNAQIHSIDQLLIIDAIYNQDEKKKK